MIYKFRTDLNPNWPSFFFSFSSCCFLVLVLTVCLLIWKVVPHCVQWRLVLRQGWVAMVANNIGRAETGIVAGNFMGVLHSVVTNHKFNQIFLRRMNNTTNFRPENSPHRTNFRSKFRVAFTPSRNLSPKVRAVQNNTCLENSRKCRRSFVSVKNSSKSQEFRRISSTGVCITFAQYCMYMKNWQQNYRIPVSMSFK